MKRDNNFGKNILDKLYAATNIMLKDVVKEALDKAEENANYPEKWPIILTHEDTKKIKASNRLMDALAVKLEEYGIAAWKNSNDYIAIDICNLYEGYDDDKDCEAHDAGIPHAQLSYESSATKRGTRLLEIYNRVGEIIDEASKRGEFSAQIRGFPEFVESDKSAAKKLIKSLNHLGYTVYSGGSMVNVDDRPEYLSMKVLEISWRR